MGGFRPDTATVEEIVAEKREASDDPHGYRLRALVVVLWRGGLRVAEALLGERDPQCRTDDAPTIIRAHQLAGS